MYILNVLLIVLMVLYKWIRNKETEGLNGQLQVFGKREEAAELFKELLRRYLCIAFGHTYVRMSEHLAHRFDGYALFKLMSVAKVCRAICVIKGKEIQESLQLYFECFSEELWSEP